VLCLPGIALLLGTACSSATTGPRNPSISADASRGQGGVLQALTVTGSGFAPNGAVQINMLMAATGAEATPNLEEDVKADGSGKIRFDRRPPKCPDGDYKNGSWITVFARDMDSGISASTALTPGVKPDCTH